MYDNFKRHIEASKPASAILIQYNTLRTIRLTFKSTVDHCACYTDCFIVLYCNRDVKEARHLETKAEAKTREL